MTKRDRDPSGGTEPLFELVATERAGAMQLAVIAALAAVDLEPVDQMLAQLALECARAIDFANAKADPYAFSQPAAQLRDTLVLLQLDPKSRGAGSGDPFDDFIAGLADDGGTGTQVRNSAKP